MDSGTAFRHATMLCMPVIHGARKPSKVLGVFQLVNKFDNLKFTRNDENFVEAFAIFCGMGLSNVRMYEKTVVAMAKQQGRETPFPGSIYACMGLVSPQNREGHIAVPGDYVGFNTGNREKLGYSQAADLAWLCWALA